MSNNAYPIGSVHRNRDLWESLPREGSDSLVLVPPRLSTGFFSALVIEINMGIVGWLLWELSR
jgi:hypothetical protein